MAYLLDTNTLIQAKNEYYGFDVCPGFWEWIDRSNRAEEVYSIDRVYNELTAGADELAEWSRERKSDFFLPFDAHSSMREVADLVETRGFKPQVVQEFMRGADPFLIAYAAAYGHTIVTLEARSDGSRRKVKIPTVCEEMSIPCIRTFDLLRDLEARFVLAADAQG